MALAISQGIITLQHSQLLQDMAAVTSFGGFKRALDKFMEKRAMSCELNRTSMCRGSLL